MVIVRVKFRVQCQGLGYIQGLDYDQVWVKVIMGVRNQSEGPVLGLGLGFGLGVWGGQGYNQSQDPGLILA